MKDDTDHPINIDEGVREWMRSLGYVHDSEVQHASSTTPRTRARWRSLRGVQFGNERWYPLDEVRRHLDALADDGSDTGDGRPAVL